jgi:hypothetical protein
VYDTIAFEASRLANRSILPEDIFFTECFALLVVLEGRNWTCFAGAAGISEAGRNAGALARSGLGAKLEGTSADGENAVEDFWKENAETGATLLVGACPAEEAIGDGLKVKEAFAGATTGAGEACWKLNSDPEGWLPKDGNAETGELAFTPDGTNALAEGFRAGATGNAGVGAGAKVDLGEKAGADGTGAAATPEWTRPRGSSLVLNGEAAVALLSLPSMISWYGAPYRLASISGKSSAGGASPLSGRGDQQLDRTR